MRRWMGVCIDETWGAIHSGSEPSGTHRHGYRESLVQVNAWPARDWFVELLVSAALLKPLRQLPHLQPIAKNKMIFSSVLTHLCREGQ